MLNQRAQIHLCFPAVQGAKLKTGPRVHASAFCQFEGWREAIKDKRREGQVFFFRGELLLAVQRMAGGGWGGGEGEGGGKKEREK